ncbi:hypothetical protein [Nocardia tengchongensis]
MSEQGRDDEVVAAAGVLADWTPARSADLPGWSGGAGNLHNDRQDVARPGDR